MLSRNKHLTQVVDMIHGLCPHNSCAPHITRHFANVMTLYYVGGSNAWSPVDNFFVSSANPGNMTDDDVRNIWISTAALIRPKTLEKVVEDIFRSDKTYSSWSWPAIVVTDKRGRSKLPRVAVHALTGVLKSGVTIIGDKRLRRNVMVPQAIFHACTWSLLNIWVQKGAAPEHLEALQLEHDLGL